MMEGLHRPASAVVPAFRAAFAAAKANGIKVAVTTSHSAPYSTDTPQDAIDMVKAWVADANVDILSPQLYSSGQETSPEFAGDAARFKIIHPVSFNNIYPLLYHSLSLLSFTLFNILFNGTHRVKYHSPALISFTLFNIIHRVSLRQFWCLRMLHKMQMIHDLLLCS
jgi:hypothetical protein